MRFGIKSVLGFGGMIRPAICSPHLFAHRTRAVQHRRAVQVAGAGCRARFSRFNDRTVQRSDSVDRQRPDSRLKAVSVCLFFACSSIG